MKNKEKHKQLLSAIYKSEDSAKHLIQKDPTYLSVKDGTGETVFHYLILENETELAELLFSCGADINTQCNSGDTPLSHSVMLNNLDIVKWLLSKGAAIELKDVNNETALSKSCFNERVAIFGLLFPKINQNKINDYFSDLEADRIHSTYELVMRKSLLEIGLRNPYQL